MLLSLFKNPLSFLLVVVLFFAACSEDEPISPKSCPEDAIETHLTLGNPSDANESDPFNYLIQLEEYALSYHRDRGIPNWVSWHVSSSWRGDADRQDDFRAFPVLPDDWYLVTEDSYRNSGFDRGHNCPSADRTCSEFSNSATFFMINMIPQAPNHNRFIWRNLEEFTRNLVEEGNEIYVIMGNYGTGGTGSNGSANFIDNGKVAVPKSIWKVLLIIPEGNNDIFRIYDDTRVIAVDMPNINNFDGKQWYDYITDVDDIEAKTGLNLFDNLPESLQATLESKVDTGPF